MPPHPPHHGPHHLPHHGDGPEWILNIWDPSMPREVYAQHLIALGKTFAEGPSADIKGHIITMESAVAFELKYERTPHATKALVVRAEWRESGLLAPTGASADGLVIRSATAVAGE